MVEVIHLPKGAGVPKERNATAIYVKPKGGASIENDRTADWSVFNVLKSDADQVIERLRSAPGSHKVSVVGYD